MYLIAPNALKGKSFTEGTIKRIKNVRLEQKAKYRPEGLRNENTLAIQLSLLL
jgi:hypothetical protein